MNSNHTKNLFLGGLLALLSALPTIAQKQPTLGNRNAEILRVGGLQFKDLNKNKKSTLYVYQNYPYNDDYNGGQ